MMMFVLVFRFCIGKKSMTWDQSINRDENQLDPSIG